MMHGFEFGFGAAAGLSAFVAVALLAFGAVVVAWGTAQGLMDVRRKGRRRRDEALLGKGRISVEEYRRRWGKQVV